MQPFKFKEIFKEKIWGGDDIARIKQRELQPNIGESFEISGVPGSETHVAGGPCDGMTLAQLTEEYGEKFLGKANFQKFGTDFPLLIKFISTASDLSVQVHPGEEMAHALGHPYGKNEMWYVVDAKSGAFVRDGFSRDFSEEEYLSSLDDGSLIPVINEFPTVAGDSFLVPAGRIHCIGGGNLIIEIQQSSDDTFRIYDYDRIAADGSKRELHVDLARQALSYKAVADPRVHYRSEPDRMVKLVDADYFRTRLGRIGKTLTIDYSTSDSFVILIAFEGSARITDSEGYVIELRAGESVLFPACNDSIKAEPIGGNQFGFLETGIF